ALSNSSAVKLHTFPWTFVVRSSVLSWLTTTTPSLENRTSSSRPSEPRPRPMSNAARVFSGASPPPPLCAKTRGRPVSKKGCNPLSVTAPGRPCLSPEMPDVCPLEIDRGHQGLRIHPLRSQAHHAALASHC